MYFVGDSGFYCLYWFRIHFTRNPATIYTNKRTRTHTRGEKSKANGQTSSITTATTATTTTTSEAIFCDNIENQQQQPFLHRSSLIFSPDTNTLAGTEKGHAHIQKIEREKKTQ